MCKVQSLGGSSFPGTLNGLLPELIIVWVCRIWIVFLNKFLAFYQKEGGLSEEGEEGAHDRFAKLRAFFEEKPTP